MKVWIKSLFFYHINRKAEKKEESPFPSQFPRARDRQHVNSKKQFTSGLIRKVDRRERGTRIIGTDRENKHVVYSQKPRS